MFRATQIAYTYMKIAHKSIAMRVSYGYANYKYIWSTKITQSLLCDYL